MPRANTSKPVKLEEKKDGKKTKMDEFAEVAKEEEKTLQSELELAKLRLQLEVDRATRKAELKMMKEQRWVEERKMKLDAKEKQAQHQHELHMAMLTTHGHLGSSFSSLSNPATNQINQSSDFLQGSSDRYIESGSDMYGTDMNTNLYLPN